MSAFTESTRDIRASARTLGVQLHVVSATTGNEVDDAFARLGGSHTTDAYRLAGIYTARVLKAMERSARADRSPLVRWLFSFRRVV